MGIDWKRNGLVKVMQPVQQSLFGGTEKALSEITVGNPAAKTYSDKVLGIEDVNKMEMLVKKEVLTINDYNQFGYLLNSVEIKLVNFSDTTRYYCGKYTTWIQDLLEICTTHLMNVDIISKKERTTELTIKALNQITEIQERAFKKLAGNYLFWIRSSLSLGGGAFDSLTTNKIEQQYYAHGLPGAEPQKQGNTILNLGRRSQ